MSLQTSFLSGVWSQTAQGRADDPLYRAGANVLYNTFVKKEGSADRRPGFRLDAVTPGGHAAKLLPYILSDAEEYNIELSEELLRFYKNGVLYAPGYTEITNIALSAELVVITMAAGHGITEGQIVTFRFDNDEAKDQFPILANRQFYATNVGSTTLNLSDVVSGEPLGSAVGTFGTSDIHIGVVTALTTPYTGTLWSDVRSLQSDDRTLLLHGRVRPQLLTTSEITPALFVDGPYLDPTDGSQVTPDSLTGTVTLTLSYVAYDSATAYSVGGYVTSSGVSYKSLTDVNVGNTPASSPTDWEIVLPVDHINSGAGFGPNDAGRHIRLYSEPAAWLVGTTYAADDHVKHDNSYWVSLQGTNTGNEPGTDAAYWVPDPGAAIWTWGKITDASVDLSNPPSFIDPAGETKIGNFLNEDRIFNGTWGESTAGVTLTGSGWAGHEITGGSAISSATLYPAFYSGFITSSNGNPIVLEIYGKQTTTPSSATDGDLLGSKTLTSDQTASVSIASSDLTTVYDFVWAVITQAGSDRGYRLSELQFFDASSVPAGSRLIVQLIGDPLLYTTAITTWRVGLYNNVEPAWPTTGCYHQGRLWLAGAVPNRFDASMSNDELVMSPTAPDGTVADNHAISYTLNAARRNQFLWMKASRRGITAGTAGGQFLIHATENNNLMAPSTTQADEILAYKSANIEPVHTGLTTVFVNQHARQIHESMRDAYSGEQVAPEITDRAKHLTRGQIAELAAMSAIDPIIWFRTETGNLAATTYERTNLVSQEPPRINAFHEHEIGSSWPVVSLSEAPSHDGNSDTIAIVTRGDDNVHHVEFLTRTSEEDDTIYDAQNLDSSIVPMSGEEYASGVRFHGLWALNGETVSAFVAGLDCGSTFIVQDGYIEVPWDSAGGLFTKRYLTQLSGENRDFRDLAVPIDAGALSIPAVVGFGYVSRGQRLRPVGSEDTGLRRGPAIGTKRRVGSTGCLFHNAQGVYFGTDFSNMRPALFEFDGGRRYTPTELFSGVWYDTIEDRGSFDGMLAWEVRGPFPAKVLAIGSFLKVEDR